MSGMDETPRPQHVVCDCGARIDATGRRELDSVPCPRCRIPVAVVPRRLRPGPGDPPGERRPFQPARPPGAEERGRRGGAFELRFAVTADAAGGLTYPDLELGEACVCCDAAPGLAPFALRPSVPGGPAPRSLLVPVCGPCRAHANEAGSEGCIVLGAGALLALVAVGFSAPWYVAAGLGALLGAAALGWAWWREARVPPGHHPLELALDRDGLRVTTGNRRLADALRARHAAQLVTFDEWGEEEDDAR